MYHVDLELTDEQVRRLKQLAFDRNQSVRGLVTELAIREIQKNQESKSEERK
jgi:predicted transcriptional regulator